MIENRRKEKKEEKVKEEKEEIQSQILWSVHVLYSAWFLTVSHEAREVKRKHETFVARKRVRLSAPRPRHFPLLVPIAAGAGGGSRTNSRTECMDRTQRKTWGESAKTLS